MRGQVSATPPAVYDREQLIALAQEGHLIKLPVKAAWVRMSSEDRQALIAAVIAYGDELIRGRGRREDS